MAGHIVTPYEVIATRKGARKNKDEPLLLAALGKDVSLDLLDLVETNICKVPPCVNGDKTSSTRCVAVERTGDSVLMVFDAGRSGEREVVRDNSPKRKVVFTKQNDHIGSYYSSALLWRPPSGTAAVLLVHSPWGRGGSKGQVLQLLQRAVNVEELAAAKLRANPMIPAKELAKILRAAKSTRITYTKSTGVTSTFDGASGKKSAPAEIDLVVKGSGSIPFRDELTRALKATANKDKFFTLSVRDEAVDGGYREETFDDVTIDIQTSAGSKRYSMRNETVPTLGFNLTSEFNEVYSALPKEAARVDEWPDLILKGAKKYLPAFVKVVNNSK